MASILAFPVATEAARKPQKWLEVSSPHFVVFSNADEKRARRVALEFEQIRAVFKKALPQARVDPSIPIIIMAVQDEESLAELLPEFWEEKARRRPSGIFRRGPDKHYVALRVNLRGRNHYRIIYQRVFSRVDAAEPPGNTRLAQRRSG